MPLQRENDTLTFLRSDNGQLDTHGVRAYCRKKSIFNQYTHPYHPNMLGFVERSFRSVKDLSRCMLQGANLPDPYWEKGNRYATLIRNILPNRSATGMVREAYFLWYGVMFDYSRLRTFGSRAYAINHIGLKDYGARSVAGIFVGFKETAPYSSQYEIYLPKKNVFVTSGDVVFCEHTGRSEPERLLPPHLMLPDGHGTLDANDFQHLVDTVHLDNDEGVQYKVLRVYKEKGFVIVDRVLYFPDKKPNENLILSMSFTYRMLLTIR